MKAAWLVVALFAVAPVVAVAQNCSATRCCSGCGGCGPVDAIPPSVTQAQCDQAQQDYLTACVQLHTDCSGTPSRCTCSSGFGSGPSASRGAAPPAASSSVFSPQMGAAFLSRGPFLENEGLRLDFNARWRASRTELTHATAQGSAQSVHRAAARDLFHQSRYSTPGCFSVAQNAKLSFFGTLGTQTAPAAQSDTSSFGDTWPPLIAGEESKLQPIDASGSGVHPGAPDLLPPPNPQPVNRPQECAKGWYFNPGARTCYFSATSCQAAGGGGCFVPNRDPALDPALGGHVNKPTDCPAGTVYNTCNRSCYQSLATCQTQIPVQSGCACQ